MCILKKLLISVEDSEPLRYNMCKYQEGIQKLMRNSERCSGDALQEWIDRSGIKVGELATLLDVEYQSVWRVANSRSRPGWTLLLKIIKVTDGAVTANDFTYPLITKSETFDPVCKEALAKRLQRPRRVAA